MKIKNTNIHKYTYFLLLIFCTLNINSNLLDELILPEGFQISIFAKNLDSPRQITETKDGAIIVQDRNPSLEAQAGALFPPVGIELPPVPDFIPPPPPDGIFEGIPRSKPKP